MHAHAHTGPPPEVQHPLPLHPPPSVCAVTVQTEVVNMAADGMVLTNHDHQTRVGILTGKDTVSSHALKRLWAAYLCAVLCPAPCASRCHDTGCLRCRAG